MRKKFTPLSLSFLSKSNPNSLCVPLAEVATDCFGTPYADAIGLLSLVLLNQPMVGLPPPPIEGSF